MRHFCWNSWLRSLQPFGILRTRNYSNFQEEFSKSIHQISPDWTFLFSQHAKNGCTESPNRNSNLTYFACVQINQNQHEQEEKNMSKNQSKADGCSFLYVVSSKICVPFFIFRVIEICFTMKNGKYSMQWGKIYGNMKQWKTAIFVLLRPYHRLRPYFIAASNFIMKRKPHWLVVGLFMDLIKRWVKYFRYSLGMLNGIADWQ